MITNKDSLDRFLDNIEDKYVDFKEIKEQGSLIRWVECKRIGVAQYGDVIKAMNVNNGEFFIIKRLELFKKDNIYNQD